jgi:hypothetical protein
MSVSWTLLFWINALFLAGFVLDNEDRSVTRSDSYFRELFSRCGLHVYKAKVIYCLFIWKIKSARQGSTDHSWSLWYLLRSNFLLSLEINRMPLPGDVFIYIGGTLLFISITNNFVDYLIFYNSSTMHDDTNVFNLLTLNLKL